MTYSPSSDHHAHNWTQFAKILSNGVNSRLQAILNEFDRQADCALLAGHKRLMLAGDLFHVRGRIEPSVFNPTYEKLKDICERGIEIFAIPGNHDLEGKEASSLGNAMQTLGELKNFTVITKPTLLDDVIMIPWVEDLTQLRKLLKKLAAGKTANQLDVIIHAPVNGVIKGIPDHGLEASELAALGFRRILSGHYHDAKLLSDTPLVLSIGATTHQTWSDPDTKAGFWTMRDDGTIAHHETAAPLFINQTTDTVDEKLVRGNYVRVQLKEAESDVVEQVKKDLLDAGALGVVDHSSRKRTANRTGSVAAAGSSVEASVGTYIDKQLETKLDKKRITLGAMARLSAARERISA